MKKYLFPALALGLVMTSCQSDEPFAPGEGGEKQVTFTLNVPADLGTRAAAGENKSDKGGLSNNAGELSYTLVLDANGDKRTFTEKGAGSVTFNPTVVLGRNYTVTAYAHFGNAWDGETAIDITKHFNDETKDAYYTQEYIKFELNETSKQITLKRPFGKLRLLATDYTADGSELNTAVESVKIEYTDIEASKFNPLTGIFDANGAYTNLTEPQTFGYYAEEADGAMPIFADYIPANSEDNMVDFTVTVKYKNSTETYSRKFNDIPVRRNALTTLKGNFFTAGAEITVDVEDDFDNFIPGEGNVEEQLIMAVAMGGSYTLQSDVTLTKPLEIGADMTLDLNGKTITAGADGYAIKNENGGKLEIKNGTVNGKVYTGANSETTITSGTYNALDGANYVLLNSEGTLIINGGTINGGTSYPIYSYDAGNKLVINDVTVNAPFGCINCYGLNGEVEINGGTFQMTGVQGKTSHIAYFSNVDATINGGIFKKTGNINMSGTGGGGICAIYGANLTINGGSFAGDNADVYNWGGTNANNRSVAINIKGGTYKFKPDTKSIAAGYEVLETVVDGVKYYSVVPEGVSVENPIVSASQLKALGGTTVSGTYNLLADIDMTGYDMKPIMLTSGGDNSLVFNGNGHTIKNLNLVQDYQNGMYVSGLFNILHSGKEITVNDLKVVNATSNSDNYAAIVLAYNSTSTVINLNNIDVDGAKVNAETVSPLVGYTTGPVNLSNCKVSNISLTGEKDEKIGAFVGTANTAGCVVKVTNCINNTEYKEAGRVINGATMTIDGAFYVTNNDGLKKAIEAGATKALLVEADGYDLVGIQKDGLTLIGLGDVKVKNTTKYASGSTVGAIWKAINLKNVTITNTVYTMAEGGQATFEDVVFEGGFRQGYGRGVKFNNCVFGSNSEGYALHFQTDSASEGGVITLSGCAFNGGKVHLGGKRSYEFTGCDFADGTDFQVWSNIKLVDCTVNGVKVTSSNVGTVFPKLDLSKVTIE